MSSINVNSREKNISSSANKLRKKGLVPGVLYGKALGNLLFEVGEMELAREISRGGEHGILDVSLNGQGHKALIKDVQRDPVTHKIIHLDLESVSSDKEIISEVPIQFIGEEWLNNKGQILQKEKGVVRVSCKVDNLPKNVKVNLDGGTVGSVYRFSDIEVGEEISIVDDLSSVIAAISNESRVTAELAEAEKTEKE